MGARLLGAAILSLSVCGCGLSQPPEEPSPVVSSGNEKPVELGCPYSRPVGRHWLRVTFALRVLADGSVDPAGVSVLQDHDDVRDATLVERARAIALECKFKPATVNGVAAEATVRKTFWFPGPVNP